MTNKKVYFRNWQLIDYKEAWDLQTSYFNKIIDQKLKNRDLSEDKRIPTDNYLFFCQHPHVYTLGKSGSASHLLISETSLKEKNVSFYHNNRGGDITYHGPGQIVGYPVLDLDNFFTDIHKYLRLLEEAVILTLKEYKIEAGRIQGLTGVWIDNDRPEKARKICAMGVKLSRWVSMHGFAFNINTELDYFNHIVPCGISDKAVTSLEKELGRKEDIALVEKKLLKHISNLFEMEIVDLV
ncbi:MAG TPA: lipoyl(octanoyl) transferase LipB [Cytophagaceae bacterium]